MKTFLIFVILYLKWKINGEYESGARKVATFNLERVLKTVTGIDWS